MTDTVTSVEEIITGANEIANGEIEEMIGQPGLLLAALRTYDLNGAADENGGDVDTYLYYFRVDRWIVTTNSAGMHEVHEFDTEDAAKLEFQAYEKTYYDFTTDEEIDSSFDAYR